MAQMKIVIDRDRCVGHARCQNVAPDLFQLDDNGYNNTPDFDVPPGQEDAARRGAKSCPERIIRTINDPSGTDWPPSRN